MNMDTKIFNEFSGKMTIFTYFLNTSVPVSFPDSLEASLSALWLWAVLAGSLQHLLPSRFPVLGSCLGEEALASIFICHLGSGFWSFVREIPYFLFEPIISK